MDVKLYLLPENFRYNGVDTEPVFVKKFRTFIRDLSEIVSQDKKRVTILIPQDFYSIPIFSGKDVVSIAMEYLDQDEQSLLYATLYNTSTMEEEYDAEVIKKQTLYSKDEEFCVSTIVFNGTEADREDRKYIEFDQYEIVYTYNSWVYLKRQILGNHPGTSKTFMQECKTCFPDINFSCNCETVIGDYLNKIPRRIVYYLSCMNDKLIDFYKNYSNQNAMNDLLADFSGRYGMDKAGSLQMTAYKKANYTFDFVNTSGDIKKKVCDPHFKIQHYDSNCSCVPNADSEKCYGRIYFCLAKEEENESLELFVGSIGPHI